MPSRPGADPLALQAHRWPVQLAIGRPFGSAGQVVRFLAEPEPGSLFRLSVEY